MHLKEPSMKSVLPYFIPTEVVLIDDDATTLEEQKIQLKHSPINLRSFENPFEALDYINRSSNKSDDIMDLNALYCQIYSPNRFKQISTIIVDYDMPGMNGLELCRQITSPHIQKIMLTGAATTDIAVEAFNEGVIHQFIQKDDPEAFTKLEASIVKVQERYFDLKTHDFVNQLYTEYPETEILKDPIFVDFLLNLIQEKQVTEYYLLDAMGSFLFLSEAGEASALFMFNKECLESQEDMIPNKDRHPDILEDIYKHRKALCFYPFQNHPKYEAEAWKKYVHPVSKLDGASTYFYAYVSNIPHLKGEGIISFKHDRTGLETK